jgi:multimeric flavodoxin WrbA
VKDLMSDIFVLIICSSPQEKGNSCTLADQAVLGANVEKAQVESILISDVVGMVYGCANAH